MVQDHLASARNAGFEVSTNQGQAPNLVGGWVIMWLVMTAFPKLHVDARETGTHFAELGVNVESFALAVLAGSAMTLMTWMQLGADSELGASWRRSRSPS